MGNSGEQSSAGEQPAFTERVGQRDAESLRELRRGLLRADGFTLFIAVCDRPAARARLIEALVESMRDSGIETVELDERVEEPLEEVLARLSAASAGPVMVAGLERSSPSLAARRPVLERLNLERPEWKRRLPRPVVFWLPPYLLTLMGSEAPDFLNWRSGTFDFSSRDRTTEVMASQALVAQSRQDLPAAATRARIAELVGRLSGGDRSDMPEGKTVAAGWWLEVGEHRYRLGEVAGARQALQAARDSFEVGGSHPGAAWARLWLGYLAQEAGSLPEAVEWYREALSTFETVGDRQGLAAARHQLGMVAQRQGSHAKALAWYREARVLLEELGDRVKIASSHHQRGSWRTSETRPRKRWQSTGGRSRSRKSWGRAPGRRGRITNWECWLRIRAPTPRRWSGIRDRWRSTRGWGISRGRRQRPIRSARL